MTRIEATLQLESTEPQTEGCRKVLVVGQKNILTRESFRDLLEHHHYKVTELVDGTEALKVIDESQPDAILVDNLMSEMDAIELCHILKRREDTKEIPVIIVFSNFDKKIIAKSYEAGAADYLVKPVEEFELLAKIKSHIKTHVKSRHQYLELEEDKKYLETTLEVTQALSSTLSSEEIIQTIVHKVAERTRANRCSIVLIDEENNLGHVLASHENPDIHDLKINLKKYPEIKQVKMTKKPLFIDDLSSNPLTCKVKNRVKDLKGESLLVVPIVWHDDVLGTLLLRTKRSCKSVTQREIDFCQVVANASFHALKNAQLYKTLQKENSQLKRLSITDQLTNIYNHGYFYARLEEESDRAARYGTVLSCIMIDIDDFKMVNDSYGHTMGDDVLRKVAQAIKGTIRKSDLVARYGGEEFAILMPHTNLESAMKGAERVRQVIENLDFTNISKDFRLTVSAGVATFPGKGLAKSDDIIALADKVLYEAKKRGKNRTFAYTSQ